MSRLLPLSERQARIAALSYVTRLARPQACGCLRSHALLKAVFRMGGRPPVDPAPYMCKKPAYWRFRALKRSHAQDGVYCWPHLMTRLYSDPLEEERFRRALDRMTADD